LPFNACRHDQGSLPFAINSGMIVWSCTRCPETWVNDMSPDGALSSGYILQAELDTMSAVR